MNTAVVKFKGKDITVTEATVKDVETILQDTSVTTFDTIFDGEVVTQKMVELTTGLSVSEIEASRPSDLRPVVEAVKEVNKDFLAGAQSILKRARE